MANQRRQPQKGYLSDKGPSVSEVKQRTECQCGENANIVKTEDRVVCLKCGKPPRNTRQPRNPWFGTSSR